MGVCATPALGPTGTKNTGNRRKHGCCPRHLSRCVLAGPGVQSYATSGGRWMDRPPCTKLKETGGSATSSNHLPNLLWGHLRGAFPSNASLNGRNGSGVEPPLLLQPRLPHGLHCSLSVHHMFVPPVALLVFQTVPCPCLPGWGQSCGPQVLGFTVLGHCTHDTESGSWRVCGVPCLGLRYHGCACMCWPLLATHPWLRVPGIMEGSRCEKSEVSQFGCCHQPWQVLAVLRGGGGLGPLPAPANPPTPPHIRQICLRQKNGIYQRGRQFEANFRSTNFVFGLCPSPQSIA